eukprot:10327854-Heterocapsa_arctica.AAC.1
MCPHARGQARDGPASFHESVPVSMGWLLLFRFSLVPVSGSLGAHRSLGSFAAGPCSGWASGRPRE